MRAASNAWSDGMGLSPELQEYAENIWRRFPELFLSLGDPAVEQGGLTPDAEALRWRCVHMGGEKVIMVVLPDRKADQFVGAMVGLDQDDGWVAGPNQGLTIASPAPPSAVGSAATENSAQYQWRTDSFLALLSRDGAAPVQPRHLNPQVAPLPAASAPCAPGGQQPSASNSRVAPGLDAGSTLATSATQPRQLDSWAAPVSIDGAAVATFAAPHSVGEESRRSHDVETRADRGGARVAANRSARQELERLRGVVANVSENLTSVIAAEVASQIDELKQQLRNGSNRSRDTGEEDGGTSDATIASSVTSSLAGRRGKTISPVKTRRKSEYGSSEVWRVSETSYTEHGRVTTSVFDNGSGSSSAGGASAPPLRTSSKTQRPIESRDSRGGNADHAVDRRAPSAIARNGYFKPGVRPSEGQATQQRAPPPLRC